MARFAHIRNNFLFGEVSPRVLARTDIDQYNQMCEELENFTVLPQGGIRKRIGTEYAGDITSSHATPYQSKIIPYKTPTKNYYIVGCGSKISLFDLYTGFLDDYTITAGGITGFDVNYNWESATYAQYGAFLVITNGLQYPLVVYVNSAEDVIAFYIGKGKVLASARAADGFFSADLNFTHLPWDLENTALPDLSGITMTPSVTTGTGTLTASASFFNSTHVGTFFRLRHSTTVGYAFVTGYTSATVVNITVFNDFASTAAATAWSECQWGRRGFPRACTFYQERLLLGGSTGFPTRIWGSQIGDLYEFSNADPTTTFSAGDDDAFYVDVAAGSAGTINFLSPGKRVFVGTSQEELTLKEIDTSFALGVLNTATDLETKEGSKYAQPFRFNGKLTFINRSGRSIIENAFEYNEDSYKNTDLTIFSEHLFALGNVTTTETLREIAWQADEKILWAITTKGSLYSLTRCVETGAFGWARHYLGGSLTSYDNPLVRSICVVDDPQYGMDYLVLLVSRTINGNTKFYVEQLKPANSDYQDIEDIQWKYLDCAIEDDNVTAQATWSALAAHLAGETVSVVADGNYLGEYALDGSGDLTLDDEYYTVAVGYKYTATITPTALQSNALFGTGMGQIKRAEEVTIIFDKTVGGFIGEYGASSLRELQFRESSVAADDPTPLFTGEKTFKLEASYKTKQLITFEHRDPLPCSISGIVFKGLLYD